MSLLVPKLLGVTEYGYWQLFIFYTSYVGFFHFGLNDGVYLLSGGKGRDELEKRSINGQLLFGLAYQLLFAGALVVLAFLLIPDQKRVFVISATALFLLLNNISLYFGYVFQAMNETKLYSFSVMIDRALFLVPLCVLLIMRVDAFEPFVVSYAASKTCSLLYCLWNARDILREGCCPINQAVRDGVASIKVGSKLMIANIASMLILGIARFLVDAAWGVEVFGKVSFSLSLVNFFITFVTQASMVLFPALRQGSERQRRSFYRGIRDGMEVVFPAIYLFYFPMVFILEKWLPQYAESMRYLAILLPVCVFNTKMDVCCTTYFKVLREEKQLLRANIATMAVSALMSVVGVYLAQSLDVVLIGVVVCIVGRSVWSQHYLDGDLEIAGSRMLAVELALTAGFVALALNLPLMAGFLIYAFAYAAYLFSNRGEIESLLARLGKLRRGV